jgi:hypothetical protein
MRGPQRDAIESSMRTTVPVFTAETRLQPGRPATVFGDWPQQRMSASTTMSGLCETTYSGDSFGYPVPPVSAASAMFYRPNFE